MQFRAIATDLDGTLLRSDGWVSDRTKEAILAAEDAGLDVVIATGRPPRWIAPIVDQLGDRGLVVCANGASVYDPARDELIEQIQLAPEVAAAMVLELQLEFPEAVFTIEQGMDFAIDERVLKIKPEIAALYPEAAIVPLESRLHLPVTKLICRLPTSDDLSLPARAQAVIGDRGIVTHSVTPSFIEISHPDVHKAATVERLLEQRGVDASEVVAFGDMPNDIEMLRWAGHGVAMANASDAVREIADEVTVDNDSDGVAVVVERVLAGLGRQG